MPKKNHGKRRSTLPCIRLLFFLITGILLYNYKNIPWSYLAIPVSIQICAILTKIFNPPYFRFRVTVINGIALSSLLVSTGYYLAYTNDIRNDPHWAGRYTDSAMRQCAGVLESSPQRKARSYQALLRLDAVQTCQELRPASGYCLVYFRLSDSLNLPQAGDYTVFNAPLHEIRSQKVPGAFDYAAWCWQQGIHHQLYANKGRYHVLNITIPNNRIKTASFFSRWQEKLSGMLRQRMTDPQAAGMAAALLVGFKAELDPELAQTYAATGVSHVIAISGMHLGLIYWIITLLLSALPLSGRLYWIKPLLSILGIWAFSLLTGAGPSVLRAAVMFSFLSGEQFFSRKMPSLNGLAASAFVLLCFKPGYLHDAGFLLSYGAVLSLLLFYQPIYHLLWFRNRAADLVWKTIAVTLAAQVLTFPLSLYYFHQFPVYFLPANLIAVPLSTLLLFIAIAVELLFGIIPVSAFLGLLLEKGIQLMNNSMEFIQALPGALWSPLQISVFQALLIYGMIAFGYRCWIVGQRQIIWLLLATALLLGILRINDFRQHQSQAVLVIYPNRQLDAADLISGTSALTLDIRDTGGVKSLLSLRQACYRYFRCIHSDSSFLAPLANRFIDLGSYTLLQVSGPMREWPPGSSGKPCILWVCSGSPPDLPVLVAQQPVCRVVIGSRISPRKAAIWEAFCRENSIPCHHLVDKGAFVMPLR